MLRFMYPVIGLELVSVAYLTGKRTFSLVVRVLSFLFSKFMILNNNMQKFNYLLCRIIQICGI